MFYLREKNIYIDKFKFYEFIEMRIKFDINQ